MVRGFRTRDIQDVRVHMVLGVDPDPMILLIDAVTKYDLENINLWNRCMETDPDAFFVKLAIVAQANPQLLSRMTILLLLHKYLIGDDFYFWRRLNFQSQTIIKSILLLLVQYVREEPIMRVLCFVISDLASVRIPNGQYSRPVWNELLDFMFECVYTTNTRLRIAALRILANNPQFVRDSLLPDRIHRANRLQRVHDKLSELLRSTKKELKMLALSAVIRFVACLSREGMEVFEDLIPSIAKALTMAAFSGQDEEEEEAAALLGLMCNMNTSYYANDPICSFIFINAMMSIAEVETVLIGVRHHALTLVVNVVEDGQLSSHTRVSAFIRKLFKIMVKMMAGIHDFDTWFANETDRQDLDIWELNFSFGRASMARVIEAVGPHTILQFMLPDIRKYIRDFKWEMRHAMLIGLAEMFKGVSEELSHKEVDTVINLMLDAVVDRHPRVRWAAAIAIKQLAINLLHFQSCLPDFQNKVRSCLSTVIDGEMHKRVRVCMIAARDSFCAQN